MAKFIGVSQDRFGNAQVGASVRVTVNGTGALAALTDDASVALANPLTTDSNGMYQFNATTGTYDIAVTYLGNTLTLTKVDIGVSVGGGGGGGTVTSVGITAPASMFSLSGTPVTGAGTLALAFVAVVANLVFAGPGSGGAVTPTYRSLVAADIPVIDFSKVTTGIVPIAQGGTGAATVGPNAFFGGPTSGASAAPAFRAIVAADIPVAVASGASHAQGAVPDPGVTAGITKYLREDMTWQVPPGGGAGSGTVTSVALTAPAELTVAGTPITTAGTLALTWATQSANRVFAGPTSGSAAAPAFRSLVAADMSNFTRTTFSDAATTIALLNHVVQAQIGVLTASRVVTFPLAGTAGAGARIYVVDESGTITATNTLVCTPAGSDTMHGGATYVMNKARQVTMWISDGTSKWTLCSIDPLPALIASKWLFTDGTSTSWATVTTSDVSGLGGIATQAASAVAITGGTIDGTSIGATTRSAGKFTTLDALAGVGATALTLSSGTQTASWPLINATQTWNNAGVVFTAVLVNVTNTGSSASSLLLDLQVGGSSYFNVTRAGSFTAAANATIIGTATVGAIAITSTNTATSGAFTSNCVIAINGNAASASSAELVAGSFVASTSSGCAQNYTDGTTSFTGVKAQAKHAGTGIITRMAAFYGDTTTTNSSGTVTDAIVFLAGIGSKSAGTTITNAYGLLCGDIAIGASNWAIKTGLGLVEWGDLMKLKSYTVAGLPAGSAGCTAYASDGRKNGEGAGLGTGVLVFKDGTAWRACDTGATVAA